MSNTSMTLPAGFGNSEVHTMSSREIAELTSSTHDNVLKTIRALIERGVVSGNETPYIHPQNGQTYREFHLDYRNTMVVVSGYSVELRARIIDRWQELESRDKIDVQRALSDPASLRNLLLENVEARLKLEAKIETDAPKVAFAEQTAAAPDAITIGQAAKILGTGRNRFSAKLREWRWLTRTNEPYQDKIEAGLLDVKLGTWDHPEKGLQRSVTALITGKGLTKLHKLMGKTA